MFEVILEKIKEFDTIIIHRHQRPDGDCMGSQFGLKHFIEASFPEKKVYAAGTDHVAYLNYVGRSDEVLDEYYENALVIVVDTSNESRISDERWKNGKYIIKIDHHDNSPMFGDYEYVDAESPACANIIVRMMREWGMPIPALSANALYFGITTDTGRFRFRGVGKEVLENAGYLIECGADIQDIYMNLYVDDPATLKLQGHVLNHFKLTPNGVAYIYLTTKMIQKFGVSLEDAANLVGNLSSIRGSMIWVAFIDQNKESDPTKELDPANEIRVRLRSRFVTINDIATNYRGGGHLQAAGATIYSKKEMKNLLKELDERLASFKKDNPNVF